MKAGETGTVLGPNTCWRGELECHEDLLICGPFEGSVRQSSGVVTVDIGAHVKAQIFADQVMVRGRVDGDIRCSGRVFLESTAMVTGNIYSRRFSMGEGAVMRGQVGPDAVAAENATQIRQATGGELKSPVVVTARKAEPPSPATLFSPAAAAIEQPIVVPDTVAAPPAAVPASLTRSGRQLPSALAAFAAGGLQPDAEDAVDGTESSSVPSSWRVRTS